MISKLPFKSSVKNSFVVPAGNKMLDSNCITPSLPRGSNAEPLLIRTLTVTLLDFESLQTSNFVPFKSLLSRGGGKFRVCAKELIAKANKNTKGTKILKCLLKFICFNITEK